MTRQRKTLLMASHLDQMATIMQLLKVGYSFPAAKNATNSNVIFMHAKTAALFVLAPETSKAAQ